MLVLGAPHLVVERLELLLAGGVDWADVEAGRALRGGRSQYHSPAQPRPPAEAPASGGGGGGHEPSLANRGMRGGFRSSNSPGLAWPGRGRGRSKQNKLAAEWLLRGRHNTDGDRGRTNVWLRWTGRRVTRARYIFYGGPYATSRFISRLTALFDHHLCCDYFRLLIFIQRERERVFISHKD
jgi:hypothetical protein